MRAPAAHTPDEQVEKSNKSWLGDVQGKAQEAIGQLKEDNQWHVYTTGHSMGGALATLCAHELAVCKPRTLPIECEMLCHAI